MVLSPSITMVIFSKAYRIYSIAEKLDHNNIPNTLDHLSWALQCRVTATGSLRLHMHKVQQTYLHEKYNCQKFA